MCHHIFQGACWPEWRLQYSNVSCTCDLEHTTEFDSKISALTDIGIIECSTSSRITSGGNYKQSPTKSIPMDLLASASCILVWELIGIHIRFSKPRKISKPKTSATLVLTLVGKRSFQGYAQPSPLHLQCTVTVLICRFFGPKGPSSQMDFFQENTRRHLIKIFRKRTNNQNRYDLSTGHSHTLCFDPVW